MEVILNCDVAAGGVPALAARGPLVLAPFLGGTVLGHALAGLAEAGVRRVGLVTAHHAAALRRSVGRGEAWGLVVDLIAPGAEPAGAEYRSLDELPQAPGLRLWDSYRAWHAAQVRLLARFAARRVGMREVAPGVFLGLRSQIAADARLAGPCWIGDRARIGPRVVVGSGSIVGDGCYLDTGAEVSGSVVGPGTYVGALTELRDSFAHGASLLHLDSGSLTTVQDSFLLGEVRPSATGHLANWLRRLPLGRWSRGVACPAGAGAPVCG